MGKVCKTSGLSAFFYNMDVPEVNGAEHATIMKPTNLQKF